MAASYSEIRDNLFKMQDKKTIRIYHQPGNFIFTVWDKNGFPLYVGGTKDINAKSFKFAFPFADITGYYYPESWPDFEDEIDRQIAEIKPIYNTCLHSSFTQKMLLKYLKGLFKKSGIPYNKSIEQRAIQLFDESDKLIFRGQFYIGKFDRDLLAESLINELGFEIVWNRQ